ncbi:MAG: ATP-dependent zinc metalloprotease FtsH [bacterium]|nr:ATP-dependent zinc metalloprotease FtsH [bacterium]
MSEEPKEQARAARRPRPIPRASGPQGTRGGWIVLAVILAVFLGSRYLSTNQPQPLELSLTEFRQRVERSEIESVERVRVVDGARTYLRGKLLDAPRTAFRVTLVPGENESLMDFLAAKNVRCPVKEEEPLFGPFLQQLLIFGVFAALMWFLIYRKMMGGGAGGMFSFGKSRARLMDENKGAGKVTFKDVAGVDEAKEDVAEVVEFLKDPKKFTKLGARIPRGILLVGPPGTGKTLLAKAIAGEAKVPFYSISGSDFEEMFVGVGASRVRDLFEQGKKNAPCIIFIDEIDSVGQKRNAGGMPAQRCADQTLNAMLVEMDGFGSNDGVIVIAATNRPDILDPALLRPGRFDRQVHVDLPTLKGREDILRIHAAKVKLAPDVDLLRLARGTSGHSGADLANIINEAALLAARRNLDAIPQAILEEARDKVFWGSERRSAGFTRKEYETTAWHESGHALLQLLLPHADPLHKVTIIPRGRALGVTMTLPEKDVLNRTKGYFLDELAVLAGGRIAEEMHTQDISTGAMSDIAYTTQIARAMVCRYGMSARFGFQNFVEPNAFAVEEAPPPYSQKTAEAIDEEVKHLVDAAYAKAAELLTANRDKLERLATTLLEKETMDGRDVEALVGIRKDHPEDTPPAPETPPEAEEERPHEA